MGSYAPKVQNMSGKTRWGYDDGCVDIQETPSLCFANVSGIKKSAFVFNKNTFINFFFMVFGQIYKIVIIRVEAKIWNFYCQTKEKQIIELFSLKVTHNQCLKLDITLINRLQFLFYILINKSTKNTYSHNISNKKPHRSSSFHWLSSWYFTIFTYFTVIMQKKKRLQSSNNLLQTVDIHILNILNLHLSNCSWFCHNS